jgi:hypothetical protein
MPSIWLVQERIDLIQGEVIIKSWFPLLQASPHNFFDDDAFFSINKLVNVNAWLKIQNKNNICHLLIFKISIQQKKKWETKRVLITKILPPTNISFLAMDEYIVSFQV